MILPRGICPSCEQRVEFTKLTLDSFRCNNCHHIVDVDTLGKLEGLAKSLDDHDQKRKDMLMNFVKGNGHAAPAKNR